MPNTPSRTDALLVPCPRCNATAGAPCTGTRGPREAAHAERHTAALAHTTPATRETRFYDLDPSTIPDGHDEPQPDARFRINTEQNLLNRRGQAMVLAQLEWVAQRRRLRGGLTDAQWRQAQRERTRAAKRQLPDPAADLTQPPTNPSQYEPIDPDQARAHTPAIIERLQ